jgi:hypothetical protein
MRFTRKKKIAAVVVFALVVVSAAVAAWFVSSLGSGSGTFGALTSPAVNAHNGSFNAVSDRLYPGTTGSLGFEITNDNPTALLLTTVSANGAITGPCAASVTFIPQSGLTIPVAQGVTLVKVPGALSASSSTDTGCQGTSVVVPVSVTFSTP